MSKRARTSSVSPSPSAPSPEIFVHWVNVVILAEYHNPSILNPDFLSNNKIVPRDWAVVQAVSTPAIASLTYDNGLAFNVDQNRLEVRRAVNDEIQDSYDVFEIAMHYLKTLPHVPYKNVGTNWQLGVICPDPTRWLLTRFYRPGPSLSDDPEIIGCAVQLSYAAPSSVCNIRFDPGRLRRIDGQVDALAINVNFHHEAVNTVRKMGRALERWPEKQGFMLDLIKKLVYGAPL